MNGVILDQLAYTSSLSIEELIDLANTLDKEGLIALVPRVAGSDMRIVNLTPKGKEFILKYNKSHDKERPKEIVINYSGNNNNFQFIQVDNNSVELHSTMYGMQELHNFINIIKADYASYPKEIQQNLTRKIVEYTEELNKQNPNVEKVKGIGREIWDIVKPASSAALDRFLNEGIKAFLGL